VELGRLSAKNTLPLSLPVKYAPPRTMFKFITFKAFRSIQKWSFAKRIFLPYALAQSAIVTLSLAMPLTGEKQMRIV